MIKIFKNEIKKILAKYQNFMYDLGSKKFDNSKNKILLIGSYQKFSSIIKELKKNRNNIIIRGSNIIGRSLFRKDVDYYITFKDLDEYIKNRLRKIDVVVVTNDIIPFERKVIKIARELGIKSLIIQHGYPNNLQIFQSIPIFADRIAVWGELTKDFLIKGGAEEEKIILTGSPQFDKYVIRKPGDKRKIFRKYNLPLSIKNIILFTAQPFRHKDKFDYDRLTLDEQKEIFKNIFKISDEMDLFLIVKLHPSNELSYPKILDFISANNHKNCVVFSHEQCELFDLIDICDISITHNSTTAVESMILKKPVITVNFSNKKDAINYAQYGCAINVTTKDMLKETINSVLNNRLLRDKLMINADRFLKYSFYKLDGLSSKRVANLIMNIINKQ
jgi:glycosyltransferase involved in cell wall biosynthesis